ncbi:response regulator [Psychromonas ossibalaenae]|uniref:response regulator n=1 Tax=Psychromonas ossibalaenae TaxID=444922 RepID=UPI00037B89F7|nr:response regulator [Psychromonas ossibalaenae]
MQEDNTGVVKSKAKQRSIFRELTFWFLILSLLPVSITCWINYQQAKNSLVDAAGKQLIQDSHLTQAFIRNWFDYRIKDIKTQANSPVNIKFMQRLNYGWFHSQLPLTEYINSYDWQFRSEILQGGLINFCKQYEYIDDLFLIDTQGNILYSVKKKSDLGVNLFSSQLSSTKFSKAVSETLESGQTGFSDLERYAPSNNKISSFLTVPLIDEEGMMIGALAVQQQLEHIFAHMTHKEDKGSSLVHYLTSLDGELRSPISENLNTVLTEKISSEQFDLWVDEHTKLKADSVQEDQHKQVVFEYLGPFAKKVFGTHELITIQNVKWLLITEINSEEVFQSSKEMAETVLLILFLLVLVIVVITIIQVKRITDPIQALVKASLKIAQGNTEQFVEVAANNEIGQLADAFNDMVSKRNQSDLQIVNSNIKLKAALTELSSQQYALDQHAIVAITDIRGTITFVNDKFCEVSGYNHDQLIGNDHRMLKSGYHSDAFFNNLYRTIESGKIWHGEVCNKSKSGELFWLDTTIAPFKDKDGSPQSYISIRTDITEQKKAEWQQAANLKVAAVKLDITKSLSAHSPLSERLSEALHNMIELPDFGFNNTACIYLYDEQLAEFTLGASINNFVINKAESRELLQLCKKSIASQAVDVISSCHHDCLGEEKHGHYILPLKSSIENDISSHSPLTGVLVLSTHETVNLTTEQMNILHDVCDIFINVLIREKAGRLLQQATVTAEQNNLLKGEFLASMSHEIRTPMNGVLGMLGLLLNSKLNEDQQHKALLAKSSAESLLGLINDILDFSKVEAGKMELDIINFNLREVLGEISEAMALRAQEKGIEIILDLTNVDHSMVKGDPGRLRQIMTNLISNSIKFTEQGEIKITASAYNTQEENIDFSCSVEDSGIGIPQDKISTLFEIFTQVDASTTRKYGGTGLGLAICQKLCFLMGGEIYAQSEVAKGSIFTFTAKLQTSHQSQKVLPRVDISKLQLLIVDDNSTNRQVLRGQLEHWGASVVEAEDGRQALQICTEQLADKHKIFDVAFLDMQMPEMDGAQLGEIIRDNHAFDDMKLVMMTSIAARNESKFFADLGFNAYFPKPATTSDLFDALNVVVDNGEVLKDALPLVTHDYLSTLVRKRDVKSCDKSLIKILLVEDNRVNQLVAQGILEELGFSADIAENGQQALSILQASLNNSAYQLIFMDCQMPVMDGYETTLAIRNGDAGRSYTELPIIAMTANAMEGDREKCLNSGMDDYIGKPIDPKLVETKLVHWLGCDNERRESVELQQGINTSSDAAVEQSLLCWDKADALHRVLNKEPLLITLIKTFIDEMPSKIDELSGAVNNNDRSLIGHSAHTIKGASANLSALALAFYCSELEKAAKTTSIESCLQAFTLVKQSYTELTAEFNAYLQAADNDSEQKQFVGSRLTESEILNQLKQLAVRLQQSDYIEGQEISPLIESCVVPDIKQKLLNLQELIGLFDLANASRLVEQIIDEIYKLPLQQKD